MPSYAVTGTAVDTVTGLSAPFSGTIATAAVTPPPAPPVVTSVAFLNPDGSANSAANPAPEPGTVTIVVKATGPTGDTLSYTCSVFGGTVTAGSTPGTFAAAV